MADRAYQQCIHSECAGRIALDEVRFACPRCGGLLDVRYDWSQCDPPESLSFFETRNQNVSLRAADRSPLRAASRVGPRGAPLSANPLNFSGVWRFRELLPFAPEDQLVTIGEGRTILQQADELAKRVGTQAGRLFLQYEGFNPSGSFKDNGMAAAFTMARRLNRRRVVCASTGNTSASMAMFAEVTKTQRGDPIEAVVFLGAGKIALGKLAQALDCGARTIQIEGDFDVCMKLVRDSAGLPDLYVMNSINPFRLEGQKTIMYRVLEGLSWDPPDWIIVPGGNLGNCSAFGKAFLELRELGLLDRIPRLAVINAIGANALYELVNEHGVRFNGGRIDHETISHYFDAMSAEGRRAKTIASAIEIGRPVNLTKALRSLEVMNGVVRQVSDAEILDAKALVGRYGYGCEPASAASVAGFSALLNEGIISPSQRVVCILTGHVLKDPSATVDYHSATGAEGPSNRHANTPLRAPADPAAIAKLLRS